MDLSLHQMILPVIFPLFAGLVCLLFPKAFDRARAVVATVCAAVTFLSVWPLFSAARALTAPQALMFSDVKWLSLRLDPLSSFILLAVTGFSFLICLYSIGYMRGKERLGEYYACLLWTTGISCGVILANNLVLLLIFWGLLGITLYLMINIGKGNAAATAAKKSFIIIGGSDCLLMLGIVILWTLTGTLNMSDIRLELSGGFVYAAFFCFVIAAFAKAGAMPFHTWVPDCGENAPASVTAFLPASLDKLLGIYLLVRICTNMFVMNAAMNTMLMLVGAGTIICAVMMALVQHDLKRLLSYHAVSQVGYMVLGIGTGTALGIAGGLFHMLNHAIYKSSLFLCAGAVEKKAGTTDLDQIGGLAKFMPLTLISCFIASLAISGIPPLNGFYSKWMVYQAVVDIGKGNGYLWIILLATAMCGSALTLASFVKVLHAVFLRKPSPALLSRKITEVGFSMWLPMIVLSVLCILFGVFAYSGPLREMIFPAVGGPMAFSGAWFARPATVLLLVAYLIGMGIYCLTTARKPRVCETYIGGETLDTTYISGGVPTGEKRDVEVTGVDFYASIQQMTPLASFYKMADKKLFDIYDIGKNIASRLGSVLSFMHSGNLQTYLGWSLIGLAVLLMMWLS